MAKKCVVLADWVASTKTETVEIQGANPQQYQAMLAQHNPIGVKEENVVTDIEHDRHRGD